MTVSFEDAVAPWVTAAHVGLIAVSIVAAIIALVYALSSHRSASEKCSIYIDRNGSASEESQQSYSTTFKRISIALAILSIAGLGLSIAYGVSDSFGPHKKHRSAASGILASWTPVAIWFCICLSSTCVIGIKHPVVRFNIGLLNACCAFLVLGSFLIEHAPLPGTAEHESSGHKSLTAILAGIDALMACGTLVACIAIPRTPQLYLDSRPVDAANSVSFYQRITISWPSSYLALAWKSKQLEFSDFKVLDSWARAKDLYESFYSLKAHGRLAKLLVLAHLPSLTAQYLLTIGEAFLILAPQSAMYRLLLVLEARDNGFDTGYSLWIWAVALGIAILVSGAVSNQMWFTSYCRISVSWRIQLSALIFAKSLRKKDVKSVVLEEKGKSDASSSQETLLGSEPDSKGEQHTQNAESRQGVVNLISVDTLRIANFGAFNNNFMGATLRIAVSFTFLGHLLGWQALLAGIVVQLVCMPVNIFFSKRYSDSQDRLMKRRDAKLAVVTEVLNGIRQIKFSALEVRWQKKIFDVREDELKAIWRCFTSDTMLMMCWLLGPVMLSAACISVYAIVHGSLPPSVAFTTLAILTEIEGTLAYLPELTTGALDAWISLRRIDRYLNAPEKGQNTTAGDSVRFENATIAWPSDEAVTEDAFKLHKINVSFPSAELSVISGRTGSGKSLMLASILGEAEVLGGAIVVPEAPTLEERFDSKANKGNWIIPSAIAFVSQQPWIENRSFRENIIFDLPFDDERYRKVLSACALEKDISTLTDGEMTEIGANGINLSGGQRWRVTLARAIYSRAGILVMDDIFSAVDSHVGRHIFENALTGELSKGRTRILVTHHVSLCLPATKYEVQLGDGKIEYAGEVDELRTKGVLEEIIRESEEEVIVDDEAIEANSEPVATQDAQIMDDFHSMHHPSSDMSGAEREGALPNSQTQSTVRRLSRSSHVSEGQLPPKQGPRKFVEEEKREQGRIKFKIYLAYFKASGGIGFWLFVLFAFAGYQGLLLARSWILRLWTEQGAAEALEFTSQLTFQTQRASRNIVTKPQSENGLRLYLPIYLGLAAVACIEGTLRYLLVFYGSIKASRKLFEDVTYAVLRAPLRWLDTVPVGRILNRMTGDFNQASVDLQLAYFACFLLYNLLIVIGIVVAAVLVSPYIILCAFVLFGVCTQYAIFFLAGAREARRLESVAKSPILEHYSAALQGVTTVRAFAKAPSYVRSMFKKLDNQAEAMWYQWVCNRWLSWRLTVIGAIFATATALSVVSLKGIDAALGGFALVFTLSFSDGIAFLLRNYAFLELGMNATERVVEYTKIEIEDQGGSDAPAVWPSSGRIEVSDLVIGYAPDLPAVLKGLTFSVEGNERIGVVGRTGAGKSSLTLALFRFLEPREGAILIDGIDISKIKLHDLRSRLSIIAQDPVLFSGTVRSNLDPFNEFSDHELREALQRVHLIPTSSAASTIAAVPENSAEHQGDPEMTGNVNPFNSLSSLVTEGGLNLSQGQRQLLCLARAIVARPKIMVLDEATSAVDKTTDELIQRSIREEFSNSTLIVIAHRLSTIADFDRILVMSDGKVAEFGTPRELMGIESGTFKAMVDDSGERDLLRNVILGEGSRA